MSAIRSIKRARRKKIQEAMTLNYMIELMVYRAWAGVLDSELIAGVKVKLGDKVATDRPEKLWQQINEAVAEFNAKENADVAG